MAKQGQMNKTQEMVPYEEGFIIDKVKYESITMMAIQVNKNSELRPPLSLSIMLMKHSK